MAREAIFKDVAQATNVLWRFMARLAGLVVWTIIAIAHLLVAVVLLAVLWWTQATPADVQTALHAWIESKPAVAAATLGVSALGILGGYWKLVKWAHRASSSGWLFRYLMRGT